MSGCSHGHWGEGPCSECLRDEVMQKLGGVADALEASVAWEDITARMLACLRGEHEGDSFVDAGFMGMLAVLPLRADRAIPPQVIVCKHCRSLYVPRGQGEPTP